MPPVRTTIVVLCSTSRSSRETAAQPDQPSLAGVAVPRAAIRPVRLPARDAAWRRPALLRSDPMRYGHHQLAWGGCGSWGRCLQVVGFPELLRRHRLPQGSGPSWGSWGRVVCRCGVGVVLPQLPPIAALRWGRYPGQEFGGFLRLFRGLPQVPQLPQAFRGSSRGVPRTGGLRHSSEPRRIPPLMTKTRSRPWPRMVSLRSGRPSASGVSSSRDMRTAATRL